MATILAVAATPVGAGADSGVSVAQDQQAALVQLNIARWDPAGFGEAFGVDLDGILPRQPLAVNANLTDSAGFKANEIAEYGYFAHQSAVSGMWPNQLAMEMGYTLPPGFPEDANNIESLHSGSPVPFNVVGSFTGSPSHRDHVLGQGWFGTHMEVGVGRSELENVWTIHTGYRDGVGVFLTGTVYDDLNGNGIMDAGEGLPGITVTAGSLNTLTNGGGGYSIQLPQGKHLITASGDGYNGTTSANVRVAGYNISADFISGTKRPVIRDYQLCKGREPTILGTGGDDVIYGTDGDDVIHGLSGKDTIYGLRGNDVICGGGGDDIKAAAAKTSSSAPGATTSSTAPGATTASRAEPPSTSSTAAWQPTSASPVRLSSVAPEQPTMRALAATTRAAAVSCPDARTGTQHQHVGRRHRCLNGVGEASTPSRIRRAAGSVHRA